MSPHIRKAALAAHVTTSVGWVGAVVTFIALATVGLVSDDVTTARGTYLVMEPTARFVLVPLALLSLATGMVQSLGTPWGLLRHYWVVVKLLITVLATAVLLVYLRTFAAMASTSADPAVGLGEIRNPSPLLHAVLALVLLLVATVLGVVKPRGLTWFGRRAAARSPDRSRAPVTDRTSGVRPPRSR